MLTEWTYRINVIIEATRQQATNALWTLIAPGGDVEAESFGVPLSANGQEPATHLGISTAATAVMYVHIADTFAEEVAGAVVSVQPYTENDWEELLARIGLQAVQLAEVGG